MTPDQVTAAEQKIKTTLELLEEETGFNVHGVYYTDITDHATKTRELSIKITMETVK